jgi:prepilin-type processing-associated H-X9-DG protein
LRRTSDGVELESHQTIPGPNLVASAPVGVALMLPALQAARESARRTQAMNKLKQIGLALHNYHDTYRAFPAGYSANADGKPLLSWRVHILPFLEEDQLYRQFHLDEPWDSPHNKELVARMPEVFRSPNSTAAPGMSNYLGVSGTNGVFIRPKPDDKMGTNLRQITDGTSHTMMTVEVPDASAVIWSKPGDFAPHKDEPKRGLVGLRPGGFNAGFADGSVRFIAESIDPQVLKAMFTKSAGEALEP